MPDTIDEYVAYLQSRGRAPATLRATRSDLLGLQSWWQQTHRRPFTAAELTARDIRRWQQDRQQVDGVRPSTINRALSSLRGFCKWAATEGVIADNPLKGVPEIPAPDLAPQGISGEAIDALLRTAGKGLMTIFPGFRALRNTTTISTRVILSYRLLPIYQDNRSS